MNLNRNLLATRIRGCLDYLGCELAEFEAEVFTPEALAYLAYRSG